MLFCPRCGAIMNIKNDLWRCSRCGYEIPRNAVGRQAVLSRTFRHSEKEKTVVVEGEKVSVPPTAVLIRDQVRCPKCGHNEVYAWQIQTRAADEPPTTFYKCSSCSHVWREY